MKMKTWMVIVMAAMLAFAVADGVDAADYVGVKKCKMCHMKQYKSWSKTRMSKAFELLKPGVAAEAKKAAGVDPNKDYTADASCLGCHTTNGKADMPGVQCEACHGAGSDFMKVMMTNRNYKREDIKKKGLNPVPDEAVCKKCHNKSSPFYKEFNYAERVKKGTHEHFPLKKQH